MPSELAWLSRLAAKLHSFWDIFGPCHTDVVGLAATEVLADTSKSRKLRNMSVTFLHLGVLKGLFWAKNGRLWPKAALIWEGLKPLIRCQNVFPQNCS